MKKFLAIVLIAVMMMAMGTVAFAEDTYTITIDGAANGETYTAYKLMDATYQSEEATAIAYFYNGAAADPLYVILAKYFQFNEFVDGKAYVKVVDAEGAKIDYSNVDVAALAAELNTARLGGSVSLTSAGSAVAANGAASIDVAAKGYYFVDTTLGSLCSIDTAKAVTIYEKNSKPSMTKQVKEDRTGAFGATANADIGQEVSFKLTVNTGTNSHAPTATPAPNGVDAVYTITDTLPAGMSYKANSITSSVESVTPTATWADPVLTITLPAASVAALGQNADIDLTYVAYVDDDAVIAGNGNVNSAILNYQQQATEPVTATVYTYQFTVKKTDAEGAPLAGVTFTLTNEADEYYTAPTSTAGTHTDVFVTDETTLTTADDGTILIKGVDEGTYTLTETSTLEGYNILTAPVTVTVSNTGAVTISNAQDVTLADNTITIVNQSGTELPSTGGIGTTIFYIVGSILVLGAAVILITRRRMNQE